MPDNIESLIQLGFAACVAGWLIKWLTSTMQDTIHRNTKATLGLQLYMGELYRLLMVHDSQNRGVHPIPGGELEDSHKSAIEAYNQTIVRLDALKVSIEKSLDSN